MSDPTEHDCEICGNTPNEDGELEHGRGCYKLSGDGGGTEYIEMTADPIRDDSTPAFAEPYPLHVSIHDMPEPIPRREAHELEVENAQLRKLLSRWLSLRETGAGCDLVTASYDAIYGNHGNSGARAPIQGQG